MLGRESYGEYEVETYSGNTGGLPLNQLDITTDEWAVRPQDAFFSKELLLLKAASALEDALSNFTRPVKTLRVELANHSRQACWQQRTPAMATGLTDHIWTVKELLHLMLVPLTTNT